MYNTSFRLPIDYRVKRRKITEGTKFVIWRRKKKLKYKVKGRLNAEEERMKIRIVAMGIGKMFRLPWTAVGNLQVAWAWYLFVKLIPGNFYDILWRCGGGDCGMHGRANSNSRKHVISEPRKITMLETKLANPKLVTSASAAYVAQLALPWNPPKWPKKPKTKNSWTMWLWKRTQIGWRAVQTFRNNEAPEEKNDARLCRYWRVA